MSMLPTLAICTLLATAPLLAVTAPEPDWETSAKAVVTALASGDVDAVESRFDPTMKAALTPDKLRQVWATLQAQAGAFQSITGARVEVAGTLHVVYVTCKLARADLDAKVALDDAGRVAGLFFVPSQPPAPWSPPDYARPEAFRERAVVVGDAPWELPGTLTLPAGKGPFPIVVLVHGSGPHDEDETIGPNKPFKDLAWGLASRGIAVLRYVKRTGAHAAQLRLDGSFTVEQETVADARAAVTLAAAQPEVDAHRVYLLGHSLGGMLAPRIAQGAPVAGVILMAASTRPLERVVVEQLKYLASLDPAHAAEHAAAIREAEAAEKEIESPTLAPSTMVSFAGARVPGSYFLDLRGYDPARTAAALQRPLLVLQAGSDYQVTDADLEGWKKGLAKSPRVSYRLYPGLYHLFMPSAAPAGKLGSPADYERPGHVAREVIDDIASWIGGLAREPASVGRP